MRILSTCGFLLIFLSLSCNASAAISESRAAIGKFQSRAIIRGDLSSGKHPVVIMLPGSGSNGPEEMSPPASTVDGAAHALFSQIAQPLNEAGVVTIALGKPGVEYFTEFDKTKWFYDRALYDGLLWQDLIDNARSAVDYVLTQPGADPERIFLLGHSEGTQVSVDLAAIDPRVKGIILLGYVGQDLATILDWQLFLRDIEFYIATDVDTDHDGFVSKAEERATNGDFRWDWKPNQENVSFSEIEAFLRADKKLQEVFAKMENKPLYSNGIFRRGELNSKAAALSQGVFVFNGELDMQTPAREALALKSKCIELGKFNCEATIVPGLGHGFSKPKPPRSQPVLDLTIGPIDPKFQKVLLEFAASKLK